MGRGENMEKEIGIERKIVEKGGRERNKKGRELKREEN